MGKFFLESWVLGRRRVGRGRVFFIAEAGVNHNGNIGRAMALVDAAARAGADAVKFQTFQADRLALAGVPKLGYQKRNTGAGTQREMLRALELAAGSYRRLIARCRQKGILFLSSPFDDESASFLFKLGLAAFKIASGEMTNHPFLDRVARWKKPLILSTGMATQAEVGDAVAVVRRAGNRRLAVLHCVSAYPARPEDVNLRAMRTLAHAFTLPAGLSDHTAGTAVSVAAAALGAAVIEKHLTLDRSLPGPDHRASLEPEELERLIRDIRFVESALGDGAKRPVPSERETARAVRKSVVALKDIPAGVRIGPGMIGAMRPGTGLAPFWIPRLIGRQVRRAIPAFTLLSQRMVF